MNTAALARDRVALVALGASLPATTAYAYERHRARAYAHALELAGDAALGELAVAAASMPPPAAVLAADGAGLQLLLGDAARSIASITLAARDDVRLDDFGRDVLLAATREAPSEWRRAARAAALVRHPRAALVAGGAAFNALGDRRAYRVAVAATGLLTALVALLALPTLLVDGGAPIAGVTAPSFSVPPSVVVVPARTPRSPRLPRPRDATGPASLGGQATLVSSTPQPSSQVEPPPGRPRAVRPGSGAPPAPSPAPSPAPPGEQPTPQPAPQPEPPTVALAAAPAAAPLPPTPAAPQPKANKGKAKAKGHAKQAEKAAAAAAATPPQPAAHAPEAQAPASSEPPGQAKDKSDKHDKKDKNG